MSTVRKGKRERSRIGEPADTPRKAAKPPVDIPPIGNGQEVSPDSTEVIDLLNPTPAMVVEYIQLRRSIAFGFAGGDTAGALRAAMHRASVAVSDWDPKCFEADMFIPELFEASMKIKLPGLEPRVDHVFLTRLLTRPPKDPAVVSYRRGILEELASDQKLNERFVETYKSLYNIRDFFESETKMFELDTKGRRLETLAAIRDTVNLMADGFADCASGLKRIARFAEAMRSDDKFQRLVELLDYDNHLASVDLKLRIGADGRVRRFEILRMSENRENRFHQSPLGRFFTRVGMLFRGYIFSEGELVNRWVDSVFEGVEKRLPMMLQLLGEMEFYLSTMAFKTLAEEKGLAVCFPEMIAPEKEGASAGQRIDGLFNPLLFGQGIVPVTCDLRSDRWETTTVVTGPNSGGKTRLLQGIATLQMLAQCGMYAPAKAATLCSATGLFVSLIDEPKADQKEGRLGTELIRIRDLFERSRPGSLIVLDELCSGTNPSEGEEIFRLVISLLGDLRPCVYITTHFLQFAARLEAEAIKGAGLRFLQVELDDQDCPTFRFSPGVANTSLAHQTAARLGVTREELLDLVRKNCGG